MASINFFKEDIQFRSPSRTRTITWLKKVARREGYSIDTLNYIFCSDRYLIKINREYLQHDDYTDIITFDLTEESGRLRGDIFISVERVFENAEKFKQDKNTELRRVMAHGLLHLSGYKDKTAKDQALMRGKEDEALSFF